MQARSPGLVRHLLLKAQGRMQCVRISEIDWCDASGNYVVLNAGSASLKIRRTITQVAAEFSAHHFIRISRTSIVNMDRILEVQPTGTGDYSVLLQGGWRRRLTRGYRDTFMERFFVL